LAVMEAGPNQKPGFGFEPRGGKFTRNTWALGWHDSATITHCISPVNTPNEIN